MSETRGGADAAACSLYFVGTATMLLRLGPFNLLTDPNFLHRGQRAYLGHGLSSVRRTEPAMRIDELPRLDAIVLSHMHGDHWDRNARRGLDQAIPIFTTSKAARALRRQGFGAAKGMATWDSTVLRNGGQQLTVTATPGQHAVGLVRRLLPPVMGSVLEYEPGAGQRGLRLYITGDTLLVEALQEIPRRYRELDVAVLHLGGTKLPGGFLVTMDARQGADLIELLHARTSVPIHNDDYGVFKSPLSEFRAEIERRGLSDRVSYVERGHSLDLMPKD